MCSCRSIAVAWVFAIVLDVEIFQVHEIIEKCKNHDTRWERPGVQPGSAWPAFTELYFYRFLVAGRQVIAYTDLLAFRAFWLFWFIIPIHFFLPVLLEIEVLLLTGLQILQPQILNLG